MKKMKIFLLVLCVFILSGCDILTDDMMDDIEVYTTTYPINYLFNYLYGDHSTIHSIYPSGINFKEYDLSDKKITEYAKSDLFVFNSQDIERTQAIRMINENKRLKLIDTAIGLTYSNALEELWLNPYNYLMMGKNIKKSLSGYINNPYLVEEIDNNYEKLNYELSKLDASYKETLANAKYTTIVADKNLFKYLEKYNIEVIVLEENIVEYTIDEGDTIGELSSKYDVSASDILTFNNKKDENVTKGEIIKIPIKVIESSDVNMVKKLISEGKIKYIYSDNTLTNDTIKDLIKESKLELVTINTMYDVDGGISNNNEDYFTVMANNLELLKKELNK